MNFLMGKLCSSCWRWVRVDDSLATKSFVIRGPLPVLNKAVVPPKKVVAGGVGDRGLNLLL